ncbi:Rossmann-fold NAD(P)-binding domain-containing protein [Roseovarius atlanticus]|uniref:hypothetical protein n=1 Tax=Roseovarius atlanticus TaxID=1641875 RepID=UPI00070EC88B|nr:hypothetical protein [Roseovarius atlanticus]
MQKTVLVLGANGRFGRHATEAFWNAGWTVRLFDRGRDDLMAAARGADIIVAAWNPPYHHWKTQLPRLHAQVQAAARVSGSAVLLPGNVYVYGRDATTPWTEATRHAEPTPLGRARQDLEKSYRESGVQTILLRAGDFIDTEPTGGWFDRVLMSRIDRGQLLYPGNTRALHSWAFLPDLARAAEHLAREKPSLGPFEEVVFPGYTLTGEQLAECLSRVSRRAITARRMPWLPLRLAAPVWPMARALLELRYLWETPHSLHSDRLQDLCPTYRDTDIEDALGQAGARWRVRTRQNRCAVPCYFTRRSTQTSL